MKNIVLVVLLSIIFVNISRAQTKAQHFYDSKIESHPDHLLSFANEEYIVLVGKNEVQTDVFLYTISWTNLNTKEAGTQTVKSQNRMNPNLFGFHFGMDGFAFFEETSNEKEKTSTLILHELHLGKGLLSNRTIHNEELNYTNKKNFFTSHAYNKFFAIYAVVQQKDGKYLTKTYALDYSYKVNDIKTTPIKGKLNLEFATKIQMTIDGNLLAVIQQKNEKEGDQLMYQIGNIRESDDKAFNELRPLYAEKGKNIHDFKVYINDESIIEFVGLYNQKTDKGLKTRMVVRYFHPLKERFVVDQDFDLNAPEDLTFHSLLPIDNEYFVVITEQKTSNNKPAVKEKTNSFSLSQNSSQRNATPESKAGIYVNYIHIQKGIVWTEFLNNDFTESHAEHTKFNPKAFDYYFWSDGKSLFALQNALPNKKNSAGSDSKSSHVDGGVVLGMRIFDLNSGNNKVTTIDVDERVNKYLFLPSHTKVTTIKYLISVLQMDKKTFYPVKLYLQY